MTEHSTLFYMEKILTFALVCAFCYMLYIISVCWLPVRESHYLLVVQWSVTMIQIPTMQRIYPGMVYMFIWRNRLGILL